MCILTNVVRYLLTQQAVPCVQYEAPTCNSPHHPHTAVASLPLAPTPPASQTDKPPSSRTPSRNTSLPLNRCPHRTSASFPLNRKWRVLITFGSGVGSRWRTAVSWFPTDILACTTSRVRASTRNSGSQRAAS